MKCNYILDKLDYESNEKNSVCVGRIEEVERHNAGKEEREVMRSKYVEEGEMCARRRYQRERCVRGRGV